MGFFFFFQAEDGIRDSSVTGVQTCALPIWGRLLLPAGDVLVELGRVRLDVLLEDARVLRIVAAEPVRDRLRGLLHADRVEVVVRVAHRVLITERAVYARRDLEYVDRDGAVDVAG